MRSTTALLIVSLLAMAATPVAGAAGRLGPPGMAQSPQNPSRSGAPGAVQGVVLAQAGGVLTLLARGNVLLTVVIAGTALVTGGRNGRPPRDEAGLARASVVEVAGPRNSDGSLSAHTVALLFDPRRAARASGRIVRPTQDGGFVLSDGTVVSFGEELWVFRGTTLLSAGALVPGVGLTVYGAARGGRVFARVIEVSL